MEADEAHPECRRHHFRSLYEPEPYGLFVATHCNLYAHYYAHGQSNVFNLAKNAGTSVEQMGRLYARNLPTD